MELCLITSNIRFDNPADGANAWPLRKENLANTLLSHLPDVIATQEGRYDQLKGFENLLNDFEMVDQHRSWIKERMYPTFYIRKNKFEFIASEDLWLSETPDLAGSRSFDSAFPRLMTWMKVQPKNSKTKMLFVNTHLDHIKQLTREQQVRVLCEQIERNLDPETVLLICGDFNDAPNSIVREILLRFFPTLQDAWKLFNQQEETSHHAFNGDYQSGTRIDWIMLDERIKVIDCQMDKSHKAGKYPSDHFPVVCKFSF